MFSRTSSRTLPIVVLATAVAVGAAACGGSGDDAGEAASPTPTVAASTATPAPPAETPPSTDETPAATPPPAPNGDPEDGEVVTVRVVDGEVEGGRRTIEASLGDQIRLRVEADVEDEVHVHGYDLLAPVAPGEPAELDFTAEAPGQFEIELEASGVTVAELQVRS